MATAWHRFDIRRNSWLKNVFTPISRSVSCKTVGLEVKNRNDDTKQGIDNAGCRGTLERSGPPARIHQPAGRTDFRRYLPIGRADSTHMGRSDDIILVISTTQMWSGWVFGHISPSHVSARVASMIWPTPVGTSMVVYCQHMAGRWA